MSFEMYTAVRGKVIIKNEYKELVELINSVSWEEAEYDFLNMRCRRGNRGEENDYFTKLNGNEWSFVANIKNYRDTKHNAIPITTIKG